MVKIVGEEQDRKHRYCKSFATNLTHIHVAASPFPKGRNEKGPTQKV
jgi:hypothetical protein